MNFANRPGSVGCVMKNPVRIYEFKRTITEWQALSVSLDEASFETCQLKTLTRHGQSRVSQVERSVPGTGASEAFGFAAASAADFEHSQSPSPFEGDCQRRCTLYRCSSRLR